MSPRLSPISISGVSDSLQRSAPSPIDLYGNSIWDMGPPLYIYIEGGPPYIDRRRAIQNYIEGGPSPQPIYQIGGPIYHIENRELGGPYLSIGHHIPKVIYALCARIYYLIWPYLYRGQGDRQRYRAPYPLYMGKDIEFFGVIGWPIEFPIQRRGVVGIYHPSIMRHDISHVLDTIPLWRGSGDD